MFLVLLQVKLLISYCSATININEPLAVSITPKIWNLLETKAHIINAAVSSITFPEIEGKEHLVKYRVWDGKVEQFSVPATGVSFQDVNNGVHLSVKGIQFQARIHGRVEIGKKVFGKWVRIARMSGDITAKSEHANLDVNLVWDDFKFIPTVTMDSNVRVDFTHHLRQLNFLRSKVEKAVNSKVDSEVPRKLIHAIEDKVNPRLQKLKQKLVDMGINNHELDWKIMNGTLRVTLKPKGDGEIATIPPMDKMVCIDASILDALEILNRSKRGLRGKLKDLKDKILGRHHHSESDPDQNPPAPPSPPSPYEGSARTESARYSYHERPGASSPQVHDLKQESIFKREKKQQEEEAAEEQQTRVKRQRKGSKYDSGDSDQQRATAQMGSAERRKRSKEPSDLQINEGAALKEMSKLYQDLLERFENLKQKQESQVATESDRTRLRRLAEKDDSVYKMLKELIATIKEAAEDFKTCAMLAGSSMKRAEHHERDLDHIILELESA